MASLLPMLHQTAIVRAVYRPAVFKLMLGPMSQRGTLAFYSSTKTGPSRFGQSMILLQDGLNIQELPIVVRRTNDVMALSQNSDTAKPEPSVTLLPSESLFVGCKTITAVFEILGGIPAKNVTADLAIQALRRIAELGQFVKYRNEEGSQHSLNAGGKEKSFTTEAIFLYSTQVICKSSVSGHIVEALSVLSLPSFPGEITDYRTMVAEECLQRICDGSLSVIEVTKAIRLFSFLPKIGMDKIRSQMWADQSWVGLVHRRVQDIDETNIVECFQALQHLNDSRRIVFNLLERRLLSCIYKLSVDKVLEILQIVHHLNLASKLICAQTSRWLSVVLHAVDEESLVKLVDVYHDMGYCDSIFCRSLERYVRAKSGKTFSQEMLTSLSSYCSAFRIRSEILCSVIADQFTGSVKSLNPRAIESVLTAFGTVNFQPQNDFEFWSAVEDVLQSKFVTFRPESMIDILLSCVYLQRFPVNFIYRVFSPYFLDRLHSVQEEEQVRSLRSKLKLLDTAMSLESTQYARRMLPKDYSAKSLARDGRVTRMATSLVNCLEKIVGPKFLVSPSIILTDLPLNDLYVADILISPSCEPVSYRYGLKRKGGDAVVILLHPPEHFTREKTSLIGPQVMRCRQLLSMGFRLVNLDLDVLQKYKGNDELVQSILEHKLGGLYSSSTVTNKEL